MNTMLRRYGWSYRNPQKPRIFKENGMWSCMCSGTTFGNTDNMKFQKAKTAVRLLNAGLRIA